MLVSNKGSETFDFNVLFHTYLRIPVFPQLDINSVGGGWIGANEDRT